MAADPTNADDVFAELMESIKHVEKAKRTLKNPKNANAAEIAAANAIAQEWIDAEWRDTAFGPMFLRQVCEHCGERQETFAGFFTESVHISKRDTTRLVRHDSTMAADPADLTLVRYFREEEVDFCAAPGCIEGFDNAPWKR